MVARISYSRSVNGGVSYNENKVGKGQAELVAAYGYAKETGKLSFTDKLAVLKKLTALNSRAAIHCVHISLNFDPSEQLRNDVLEQIAERYMEGIGFGGQPFLVYRHFDAGHPHIHIVTTNIRSDGSRISLHNIGRNQSEKTRKEIESEFGLVKAHDRKLAEQYRIEPIPAKAVQYGKQETRKAISDVVREVVRTYRFTSLPELNAVLSRYHVMADRGSEDSFLYKKRGLQYRIIDANGNRIGVPVKASTVSAKPTLSVLEKKFELNELLRKAHKEPLKHRLSEVLTNASGMDRSQFLKALAAKNINVVLRENAQGRIYGVTYIDRISKCVFNGSDLGKEFSANAVAAKMMEKNTGISPVPAINPGNSPAASRPDAPSVDLIRDLISPEKMDESAPLLPKKRKKKRRGGPKL